MAVPSVTNSAANSALNSTVDVTLTVSSASDRVLIGFAQLWAGSAPDFTSVTFDPGGSDEDSFSEEAGSVSNYSAGDGTYWQSGTWYLILSDGVSSGDYTVRFTGDISGRINCIAWEVADANTTDPIGASGTGGGFNDTLSVSVTTTAANSLVAMGGHMREEVTFTAGTNDTEETDTQIVGQSSSWSGYTPAVSTNTYEVSAQSSDTPNNDTWCATGVEILEAAAAAGLSINISPSANYVQVV